MTRCKLRTPLLFEAVVVLLATGYAILRYHLFKEVPLDRFPLFVLNKAVAWMAVMLFLGSLVVRYRRIRVQPDDPNDTVPASGVPRLFRQIATWIWGESWGSQSANSSKQDRPERSVSLFRHAVTPAVIHVLMSLSLLRPAEYPNFFCGPEGSLTFSASLVLLTGIFGLVAMGSSRRQYSASFWLFPLLLTAHSAILGWAHWWTPADWPGGMPPISLWSALMAAAMVGFGLAARRSRGCLTRNSR